MLVNINYVQALCFLGFFCIIFYMKLHNMAHIKDLGLIGLIVNREDNSLPTAINTFPPVGNTDHLLLLFLLFLPGFVTWSCDLVYSPQVLLSDPASCFDILMELVLSMEYCVRIHVLVFHLCCFDVISINQKSRVDLCLCH